MELLEIENLQALMLFGPPLYAQILAASQLGKCDNIDRRNVDLFTHIATASSLV